MDFSSMIAFQSLTHESARLESVKFQIEKDFGLSGFCFSTQVHSWEELIGELTQGIQQIRDTCPSNWMKIVYRVDLTEKQYRFIQELGGDSHENLAKAVVLREFQKIVTREQYRKDIG
jgi:hypothetical protein